MRKILLDILGWLIKRDFGEKCPDFHKGCVVCDSYKALETLKENYETA